MLLKIIFKKLWYHKLSSLLCVILLALGVAIISLVIRMGAQLEQSLNSNARGIDMVLGAKGSPLQLVLSAVYQMDAPTGNISSEEAEVIKRNPMIKSFTPLSYGDNYKNFRIVGTEPSYLELYKSEIAAGRTFEKNKEVVIGNQVAKELVLGEYFLSSHGLDADGELHENDSLHVVGILKPSGTILDKLIITNQETVHEAHGSHDGPEQITAALIKFRSPLGMMTIPRMVNEQTTMQAALPSIEINRLLTLFSDVFDGAKWLAYCIMVVAGLSVFISLYNSMKEHKNEKALLMTLGAGRSKVFGMMLLEGLFLSIAGLILGLIVSRISLAIIFHNYIPGMGLGKEILTQNEIYLIIASLFIGVFSALLPALSIFKLNISETLSQDL